MNRPSTLAIAFYESQPPWSEAPGGICSYVIHRACVLGSRGLEVWWCNRETLARWEPQAGKWVDRESFPARRFALIPEPVRHAVTKVNLLEVPESVPLRIKPGPARLLLHWHTAESTRGWLNRQPIPLLRRLRQQIRERRLCRIADRILAPSLEMALLQCGRFGLHPDKVSVLPHVFAPLNHLSKSRPVPLDAVRPYVLMVGNLEYFKGFDLVARGFDQHRKRGGKLRLWFAGCAGPSDPGIHVQTLLSKPSVAQVAHRHGADWVRFLGRVSHTRLAELLSSASAVIVGSRFENLTLAAGEAALSNCPILLSDRCGWRLPAALCQGARLIDPYDPEDIANALDEVANPASRALLVQGARRLAAWMTSEELIEKTMAFYRSCAA